MSDNVELRSRIDVLERFILKHFSHIYARIEPAATVDMLDGMKSIFTNSPKEGAKPTEIIDKKVEGISTIFRHPSSKR